MSKKVKEKEIKASTQFSGLEDFGQGDDPTEAILQSVRFELDKRDSKYQETLASMMASISKIAERVELLAGNFERNPDVQEDPQTDRTYTFGARMDVGHVDGTPVPQKSHSSEEAFNQCSPMSMSGLLNGQSKVFSATKFGAVLVDASPAAVVEFKEKIDNFELEHGVPVKMAIHLNKGLATRMCVKNG